MNVRETLHRIESRLDELTKDTVLESNLIPAMRYSLLGGGKRARARLVLAACEATRANAHDALDFACAIEMIHAFSLIHDDLPAMDDDDTRRGKPSNHIEYGEAMAILAGDALLAQAFEVMASRAFENCDARYLRALRLIASSSGALGMAGGQALDIESEMESEHGASSKIISPLGETVLSPVLRDIALGALGIRIDAKPNSLTRLKTLHAMKTGALIKASVMAGLMIGGASDKLVRLGEEFGLALGMWFQVQDDILDAEGSAETLGKKVGKDAGKLTFVTLLGLDGAKTAEAEYASKVQTALGKMDKAGLDTEALRDIVISLDKRVN